MAADSDARHLMGKPRQRVFVRRRRDKLSVLAAHVHEALDTSVGEYLYLDVLVSPGPVDQDVSSGRRRQGWRKAFRTRHADGDTNGVGSRGLVDSPRLRPIPTIIESAERSCLVEDGLGVAVE
jgi:hypothetical protein